MKQAMCTVSAASRGGPLVGFLGGFAAELEHLGYSSRTIETQVGLAKHLSRWLAAHGLVGADLGGEVIDRFVSVRRVSYSAMRSGRALVPLLTYLRKVAGVPAVVVALRTGPAGVLLADINGVIPIAVTFGHRGNTHPSRSRSQNHLR